MPLQAQIYIENYYIRLLILLPHNSKVIYIYIGDYKKREHRLVILTQN